ncbi:hypothetical protein BHM03_00057860 [Ensete ventricosum]|nr:hypothetical protein BHM03_00057860 [Ensete ventricosum]
MQQQSQLLYGLVQLCRRSLPVDLGSRASTAAASTVHGVAAKGRPFAPPSLRHQLHCPCALARPRSSRYGAGARPDGWYLRVRLGKSAAGMVELGSGGMGVVDHPYMATWLPLWLTMPSYTPTTPDVLTVRDASTGKGISLTCVRSAVRPLGIRPYLCQVDRTTIGAPIPASDQLPASSRPRRRASCPKKR